MQLTDPYTVLNKTVTTYIQMYNYGDLPKNIVMKGYPILVIFVSNESCSYVPVLASHHQLQTGHLVVHRDPCLSKMLHDTFIFTFLQNHVYVCINRFYTSEA